MGNSTWVTDAKLQNLRNAENSRAQLEGDYNATLYNALLNAIQRRDDNAYSQAWDWLNYQTQQQQLAAQQEESAYSRALQWWQYDQSRKGKTKTPERFFDGTRFWDSYEEYLKSLEQKP